MATKKEVKPSQVKRVGVKEEKKPASKLSETKKVEAKAPAGTKKKVEAKPAKATKAAEVKPAKTTKAAEVKPATKKVRVDTSKPIQIVVPKKEKATSEKTVYHVSKRDNDGREWKVFIQGSSKVIKLFPTQADALSYARELCKNKDDGSYVLLHGLDGKIRKY